jgi:hypothetical protein
VKSLDASPARAIPADARTALAARRATRFKSFITNMLLPEE